MCCPIGLRISDDALCQPTRISPSRFHPTRSSEATVKHELPHDAAMELFRSPQVIRLRIRLAEHFAAQVAFCSAAGRTIVRVLPSDRLLSTAPEGAPLPDSQSEAPPVI